MNLDPAPKLIIKNHQTIIKNHRNFAQTCYQFHIFKHLVTLKGKINQNKKQLATNLDAASKLITKNHQLSSKISNFLRSCYPRNLRPRLWKLCDVDTQMKSNWKQIGHQLRCNIDHNHQKSSQIIRTIENFRKSDLNFRILVKLFSIFAGVFF